MSLLKYYIIDTETTGLSAAQHEIIQISIIRCEDKFQKTVNIKADHPERASKQALDIQGKTFSDLKKGMPRREAFEEVHKFILEDGFTPEHRCMVAHNYSFDQRFMHEMWRLMGESFPAHCWLCTKEFTRKFAKKQGILKPKLNLQACLELTGLTIKHGAHNAVVDSANTNNLFDKLMGENLGHVSLIKRIPHNITEKINEELEEDPNVY